MGRAYRRMWRVVPCTSRRSILRTESNKDIQEILNTKLSTIKEEPEPQPPEISDEKRTPARLQVAKCVKKMKNNDKKGRSFVPRFKESYALFLTSGFASKNCSFDELVH